MPTPGQHGRGFSIDAILNRVYNNTNTGLAAMPDGGVGLGVGDNNPPDIRSPQQIMNLAFRTGDNSLRLSGT